MTLPTWSWIPITLFAVAMQTVRTAGQKRLAATLSPFTVTMVRYLFGLPFVGAYLWLVMSGYGLTLPSLNGRFITFASLAAVTQIAATILLIHLFSLRNFAVGTAYVRTEAFLTALLGVVLFGEWISPTGWLAILVSVAGIVLLSMARSALPGSRLIQRIASRAALVGLSAGLLFAICSLSLRQASLSFQLDNALFTAGLTLFYMVVGQALCMLAWLIWRAPGELSAMFRQGSLTWFVGMTSALGSMGWFVAMTLERAAYVKALGQVEFVLALAISTLFFGERSNRQELLGMVLMGIGITLLLYAR